VILNNARKKSLAKKHLVGVESFHKKFIRHLCKKRKFSRSRAYYGFGFLKSSQIYALILVKKAETRPQGSVQKSMLSLSRSFAFAFPPMKKLFKFKKFRFYQGKRAF